MTPTFKQTLLSLRSRFAFPALAVAMGLSTLIAGLDRTQYLLEATGSRDAISSEAQASSTLAFDPADPTVQVSAGLVATPQAPVVDHITLDTTIDNHRIDSWVKRFTTSLRGDFSKSLTRMDKYATMITGKLDAAEMPRELIYLAMIESNFNPNAKSRVGAVGMWQFMAGTARSLGLRVKGGVDERKDPAEATDAALKYLSSLHNRFGSWYLAAAAYNSGPGAVSKALRKVTGKTTGTDEDFFRIAHALPKETREYVPKLIAAAKIGSDPTQHGFGD
jgi:membrane-bound lytic murein transglycosylase D